MRTGPRFGVLVACALVLVACGNANDGKDVGSTTSSSATSSVTPPPRPVVSPSLLDAGPYPTVPRPPLGVSGNPAIGAVADARHMADYVLGPWEVDEALVGTFLDSYYVIGSTQVLESLGPPQMAAAAGEHGLINGFASARQDPNKSAMVNAVMRFPDPAAAAEASKAMSDATAGQPVKGITPTAVAIPGHPDAVASSYDFTPQDGDKPRATVRSFTAHGPYVFMQFVQSLYGLDRAATLVARAIDAQVPLIDRFTPSADLAAVPLDPTGLLARTLPAAPSETAKNAVYDSHGAGHFQSNPVGSRTLFEDTGTTEVAMGSTNVYQAKDEDSAAMIVNSFISEVASQGMAPADGVAALPDGRCFTLPKAFYCVVPAGRYAIEVRSEQLADVHQQLAAQYVMLTAK